MKNEPAMRDLSSGTEKIMDDDDVSKSNTHRIKTISYDPLKVEGLYYRGWIKSFNPKSGYGFVETIGGDDIFFYADQVRLEGKYTRRSDIKPGKKVGFDVGWADRGLRVSKMNIFRETREKH